MLTHVLPIPAHKHGAEVFIIDGEQGAAAGIVLGWLYLTDSGAQYRRQLTKKAKEALSDTAADLIDKKTILPKKAAKVATDAMIKE